LPFPREALIRIRVTPNLEATCALLKTPPSDQDFYTSYVYYNVFTNPAGQLLQPGYSNISVYETVSQPNSNFPVTEVTGSGGTNSNSQVVDTLSIYGSSPLPSNFSATADQYLGVGGFIVRHNTLSWSQSGPTITNLGPFN